MAALIVMAVLAAFGLLCILWTVAGIFLPSVKGAMVCTCSTEGSVESALRRYLWLRGLGLVRCGLILVDCGMTAAERRKLPQYGPGITVCAPEELLETLKKEGLQLGGTGT